MADRRNARTALLAACCAGTLIAQYVGGKATRDAFFLSNFEVSALPTMVIVAAMISIVLIPLTGRLLGALGPRRLVPTAFAVSAAALGAEWALSRAAPRTAAVILYVHIGALGSILISWFWSLINERFDPRTAKQQIGRIAGGATIGGLLGGLAAERVSSAFGIAGTLPFLGGLHVACGVMAYALRAPTTQQPKIEEARPLGLALLGKSAYLRDLAVLVGLGSLAAALLDYAFKTLATTHYAKGAPLMRFFALFYTGAGLVTFLVQIGLTRRVLEKLGLARTVASLPITVIAGGAVGLVAPGLSATSIIRGGEMVLRSSLYRSGYELFYMPVPPAEKRAVKTLIDVGCERLGDAMGGGLVKLTLLLGTARVLPVLFGLAMALSACALAITRRLHRGYQRTLERSLLARAGAVEIDRTTRSVLLSIQTDLAPPLVENVAPPAQPPAVPDDPLAARIGELRSGDFSRVRAALAAEPLSPALVPHVLPLIGWDEVASLAIEALRNIAPSIIGQLGDALVDPQQEFAVRRRLPRVLSVCDGSRVTDVLLCGLEDKRFEVRYQCSRALARVHDRNPELQLSPERVLAVTEREVAVERRVWEGHRLLDELDERDDSPFVGEFLRQRASRSLEHVFVLLSLVLPAQPLIIAFRGLHTNDEVLRGTALEYLEGVLPPAIREALWPYLEDRRSSRVPKRSREEILASLLRSNTSIELNLRELRGRLMASK